ncbi:MAG: PorV/PorQ family protein [Rhodothermales bacterium]
MSTRYFNRTLVAAGLCLSLSLSAMAQDSPDDVETQKRGQTGMKFLSTSVDARTAAIGSAVTAETEGSSVSLFYNPASMAGMPGMFHVGFGRTDFIASFGYNNLSLAFRPSGANYGVFGLSFVNVDYGDFFQTVRAENAEGFEELGTYSPQAFAAGLGYARSLTDRFSIGAHVKYVKQDLGSHAIQRSESGDLTMRDYAVSTAAVDFGILYRTGFRSMIIAMSTRNFSQELTYVRENFELPLSFQIGVAMDVLDLMGSAAAAHALNLKVDATRPRDFTEHFKFGAEYVFAPIETASLALRAGLGQDAEEEGISLGAGLGYDMGSFRAAIDYAYTDFGVFGSLNRFALQIGF